MRQVLEKVKLLKWNITREERLAVVDTIIILPSGNYGKVKKDANKKNK